MIIKCNNCNKNFDLDSGLIPEKGRLLQCNACNHKWFFKKKFIERSAPIVKIEAITEEPIPISNITSKVEIKTPKTMELLDKATQDAPVIEKISTQNINETEEISSEDETLNIKTTTNKKSYNILGLTIVFIISIISIIMVLDTFQSSIGKIVPNFEFVLYNLYETINDVKLFLIDLF